MNLGRALRNLLGYILGLFGYEIIKGSHPSVSGVKLLKEGMGPAGDLGRLLADVPSPLILDVGANIGQSLELFISLFPSSTIHCFEPTPEAFLELSAACESLDRVTPWSMAVGSEMGVMSFRLSNQSVMNSFLAKGEYSWAEPVGRHEVEVITLDEFASQQGLEFIHLLKIDTQGFDFEVLKGAKALMDAGKISIIMFEHMFLELYRDSPRFDDVFRFLKDRGYLLVNIHDIYYQRGLLSWMNLIFIHERFYQESVSEESKPCSPEVPDPWA